MFLPQSAITPKILYAVVAWATPGICATLSYIVANKMTDKQGNFEYAIKI